MTATPTTTTLTTSGWHPLLPKSLDVTIDRRRPRRGDLVVVDDQGLFLRRVQRVQSRLTLGVDTHPLTVDVDVDDTRVVGVAALPTSMRWRARWARAPVPWAEMLFALTVGRAFARSSSTTPTGAAATLRPLDGAHHDDVDAVCGLLLASFGQASQPSWTLASGVFCDGTLVAVSFANRNADDLDDDTLVLHSSVTHPAHRGRGHGQQALRHLLQQARAVGGRALEGHIHLRNHASWRRARRCGLRFAELLAPEGPGLALEHPMMRWRVRL